MYISTQLFESNKQYYFIIDSNTLTELCDTTL
ncbi:hypothetical protein CLV59_104201 [Chitinophaga dinghuensis]|uniref:Uncharacterized protein n=1 Tax=Chitinophaga dinghuensis TaxID=1539050 RepID=A0A327W153_9BACT|nr:hypothetical protein CLV59_104201 [Chitinophaga dinghuensis]